MSSIDRPIKVANYLIEFKCNKFRISLPSRRESECIDEPGPSTSNGSKPLIYYPLVINNKSSTQISSNLNRTCNNKSKMQNTASLGYLQKHLEYVYFNEDLLNCLHKILNLKTIEQINGSDELSQVINFRCMVRFMLYSDAQK